MTSVGARGSAVEVAYQALRERIVSGSYEPGHAFSQVQLARELDLSRTPLREALQRLEAEGLVVSQANRGVVVAPIDLFDLEASYALRLMVEPAVVAAVVDRVDSADVGEMREALAAMRASDQSSREFQLAHWDFHRVILRRCPTGFQTMIESQLTQIDRHQRLYFSRAVAVSDMTATDAKFLDAVEAGDADAARDILTFHLLDTALGVIATQDPGHRFCTLPIAVRGQAIGLEGLDELGEGQRAQISWCGSPADVVRELQTTHLQVV
ncbi:GntR family transcriptional regulator [Gordonia paraffinivorans]|uniref:GntR family transcriptional regulator n=1 Tax=Gordonia paraffinivorans TaxID=175628 RepID=UPI00289933B9|nr:GntR family transcriptional regulator [Gordonia paraffinivorans]